jgi:hypothetical protein
MCLVHGAPRIRLEGGRQDLAYGGGFVRFAGERHAVAIKVEKLGAISRTEDFACEECLTSILHNGCPVIFSSAYAVALES